jgi:hypothetical protein
MGLDVVGEIVKTAGFVPYLERMRRGLISAATVALAACVWLSPGLVPAQQAEAPSLLKLETDPPRAFLKFGSADSLFITPADTLVSAGYYRIESSLAGYSPLVHEVRLAPGDTVTLHFILLVEKPVQPSAEDLGMVYQPVTPMVPEEQALAVRKKYNTMAEIFAIVPLAQGVMAAVALGGGSDYFTGELVIVGACLSIGSFVLGRIMSSRKMSQIKRTNEELVVENSEANRHNKDVEMEIRRAHAQAMREWQAESQWRGRVEITQ